MKTGNAAMGLLWTSRYASVNVSDGEYTGQFAVLPWMPSGDGVDGIACVDGWAVGISQSSSHKEAARKFIEYIGSYGYEWIRGGRRNRRLEQPKGDQALHKPAMGRIAPAHCRFWGPVQFYSAFPRRAMIYPTTGGPAGKRPGGRFPREADLT